MNWSIYLPAVSLVVFLVWMVQLTLRAQASLGRVGREVDQVSRVIVELEKTTVVSDQTERWLPDLYAFITRNSFSGDNPLLELLSRFHAVSSLAAPNLSAILDSVHERETDKLEIARETPGSLLLLGIMGTVAGMVIALSTFGSVGLQGEAEIDIGRIVSSMFLAFISTGVALLLSVFLRSRLERVALRQSKMLGELENYAFTQIAPRLLPKHDQAVQARFHELMDRQQAMLGETLERSSVALVEFSSAIGKAQALADDLSGSMALNAAAVSEVGERVSSDLNTVGSDISGKLLEVLQHIKNDLGKQRADLETIHREARVALEEEKQATLRQAETFRRNSAATLNLLEMKNQELMNGLNSLSTHLSAHVSEQTESVRSLQKEVARLSERLVESQERYQQTFLETVRSFLQDQFGELSRSLGLRRRN